MKLAILGKLRFDVGRNVPSVWDVLSFSPVVDGSMEDLGRGY